MGTERASGWYTEGTGVFGPAYLAEYESLLTEHRTALEVAFVCDRFNLPCGASLLDVPCGHGRHAIPFAVKGYHVTGIDLNAFFLAEATKRVDNGTVMVPFYGAYCTETDHAVPVNVRFMQGDMRSLAFDEEFDAAVNLFTALGYFDDDADDLAVLAGIYRALRPGGQFMLDYLNISALFRRYRAQDHRVLPDGSYFLVDRTYDPIGGYNYDTRTRIADGRKVEEVETKIRMYAPCDLVRMAQRVGFRLKDAFGDFEGGKLTFDSERVILHFVK
jgi:SAM-dependent methyltransferase